MKYLLDTNICIHFFRGKFNLLEKIESEGLENCAISEVTLAELVYGVEYSDNPQKKLKIIEDFIIQINILPVFSAIYTYGKEKARLRRNGNLISDFDLLIGVSAVESNLIMVTENIKDFKRISNIQIENWVNRS